MSLSHLDEQGRARMVDVGEKADTERVAVARGEILMRAETLALIRGGGLEKGDVLAVARVAGIMGAKRTSELIPMCHPLLLTNVQVDFELPPELLTDGGSSATGQPAAPLQAIAVVLVDKVKPEPRANRVFGPIPREIGDKGYQKIISLAPEVV